MATAREILLKEVLYVVNKQKQQDVSLHLKFILESYRVQEKIAKKKEGVIARDALFEDISTALINFETDKAKLRQILNEYRVQHKKGSNPFARIRSKGDSTAPKEQKNSADVQKAATLAFTATSGDKLETTKVDPVVSEIRTKPSIRGNCPKCHSLSVSSAPSTAETYIYCYLCGWRKYFSGIDGDIKNTLGKELFSRIFDGDDHK